MRKYGLVQEDHVVAIDVVDVLGEAARQLRQFHRIIIFGFVGAVLDLVH
jgi:hypothetical protein